MLCAAAAMTLLVLCVSPASALEAVEKLLPQDTLLLVKVKGVPQLVEKLKKSSVYDLTQNPDVQRFLEKPRAKINELLSGVETQSGVKLDDVKALFQGQAAVAITAADFAFEKPPQVVLMIEVGKNAGTAKELMNGLLAKLKTMAPPNTVTLVDVEFAGHSVVKLEPVAGAASGGAPTAACGVAADLFIVGTPARAVEQVLVAMGNPPAQSLATSDNFRQTLQRLDPDPDYLVYIDAARILAGVRGMPQSQEAWRIINALGVENMLALGLSGKLTDDASWGRGVLRVSGAKRGAVKMIVPEVGDLFGAEHVPADAFSFLSVRYNLVSMFRELEQVVANINPQFAQNLQAGLQQMKANPQAGVDVREEVLPLFGPRFAFYSRYADPANIRSQQIVFLIEIRDKGQFEALYDKLRKLIPPLSRMQPKDYMGHKVYSMNLMGGGGPPMQHGAGMAPAGIPVPGFVALSDRVVFATQVAAVKEYLRNMSGGIAGLKDRTEFRENLRRLPTENLGMILFQDPGPQVEAFMNFLKTGVLAQLTAGPHMPAFLRQLVGLIDTDLLPEAKVVKKYLTTSASCAVVTDDGVVLYSYGPLRPRK